MRPDMRWYIVGIVGLLLNGLVQMTVGINPLAKYCDNMDLSTFCIIGNHFRQVVYDDRVSRMRYYPQFRSIVTTFFPPFYDVVPGDTGEVQLWPWIQDNQDDIEYSRRRDGRTLLEHRVIKTRSGTTESSIQGYLFNLYSVNDLCSLDKLYSPVYSLYTFDDPAGKTQIHLPSQVRSPGTFHSIPDYRMYYNCGPYEPWPPGMPAPYPVPATCPPPPDRSKGRASFTGRSAFEQFMENPFDVKVTEISFNGHRLHNYLHFQIGYKSGALERYGRGPPRTNLPGAPEAIPAVEEPAEEGISYAFLIVHDQDGNPIGDFNTGVPCGTCQGRCRLEDKCHQTRSDDTIPCMVLSKDAVTHPGQVMFHFRESMTTFHATWRFAQSASVNSFVREIHIKTLLVLPGAERRPMVLVRDGRIVYKQSNLDRVYSYYDCKDFTFQTSFDDAVPEHCYHHSPKYGVFGWNAKYPILYPTIRTLGAWDYLNLRFLREELFNCHVPLNASFYSSQDYPTYGRASLAGNVLDVARSPKWEVTDGLGPSLIMGSKSEVYQGLSLEPPKYYTGVVEEEELRLIGRRKLDEQKYLPKDRDVNLKTYADTQKELRSLKRLELLQEEERCRCARFGTAAPPPEDRVPPIQQLDGRRDHSIQMTIAWIALVPFAIFVSRYFKETYSKVFFLQEFWWYTMHVLTFFLAVVFMLGGIYAIEIKREEDFNWADPRTVLHAVLGTTSVILFIVQFFLGVFRLKSPLRRRFQIFLHWFFGISNYFLALGTMFVAAFIRSGCMGCPTLIAILIWLLIQLTLYIIMEVHMRMVDKQMNLNPKRTYLPPPVMRIFHKDAPGSKFRIIMLTIFGFFSTFFYAIMHFTIEFGPPFRSCFFVDEELEAIQLQYIQLI